jgi:arginyl-tRNA--protein-N-Asp/Glu arginylyltransferase
MRRVSNRCGSRSSRVRPRPRLSSPWRSRKAGKTTSRLEKVETFNREYYALFKNYLECRRDEIRAVDLGLAAFVCVTSIEALTHTAVLHHKIVSDEAMNALIDEATRLIVGYLMN